MRATVVEAFGGPDVLVTREVPDPVPGPGQVLVRTDAADVLFLDTMLRSGAAPPGMAPRLPWTPGTGGAGEVVGVGPDVDPARVGTRVAVHTDQCDGYAELIVAALDALVPIPDAVPTRTAAALLHDGPTGVELARLTGVGAGRRVLVLGASGGLGITSIQLAAGADRVVAVARGERKLDRLRTLGGSTVVDSEEPDWPARARDALGGGADVVLDNVGGRLGATAFDGLLADRGHFSAHGTPSGSFTDPDRDAAARRGITVTGIEAVQFSPERLRALTARAFDEAARGVLRPVVGQAYPLDAAAEAHAAIEARSVFGKTLLDPR